MSYTKLLYHIVLRPKYSLPVIREEHEKELYRYIWGFVKNKGCILIRIGGMPDHIHLLVETNPTMALSEFMRDMKTSTSMFIKNHSESFPKFEGWGKSFYAMTCSYTDKEVINHYIMTQKEHHKGIDFKEELKTILEENHIQTDDYVLKD
jgi:putative transposase